MTALKETPRTEPEVLIEEARRRQRRRRASLTGVVAVVLAVGAVYGGVSGGGSAGLKPTTNSGGSGVPTATWHELSAPGGYLTGAELTNVTRYRGELLTFGYISERWPSYKREHVGSVSCARGCGPVVWASTDNGAHWRSTYVYKSGDGVISVVKLGQELLMFSEHGLWRSTDGLHWKRSVLPGLPRRFVIGQVAVNGRRLVLTGFRDGDGIQEFWTSPDGGAQWTRSRLSLSWQSVDTLSTAGAQFVVAGWSGAGSANERPTIWRSANGESWTSGEPRLPQDDLPTLAVSGGTLLVEATSGYGPPESVGGPDTEFLRSSNGGRWARVDAPKALTTVSSAHWRPQLLTVDGGFLAYVESRGWIAGLWWSRNGASWTHLKVRGAPPPDFRFEAVGVDGRGLIFINQAYKAKDGVPTGGNTFWRLNLSNL